LGEEVEFWRSNKTSFFEPGFKFEWHDTWYPDEPTACSETWAVCNNTYQNSSLVTQTDGHLFMIAGRNENIAAPIVRGDDLLVLNEITGFEEGGEIEITQQGETRVVNFKNDSSLPLRLHPRHPICGTCAWTEATNADLLAGGNTYISPSGELLFYAVTHYHDGPTGLNGDPIVRMVELRHVHVVRDGSPTYDVMADAGGPYVVDEGSSIQLDGGNSAPPAAAPWAQLFEHKDFAGQSVMFDYADRNEDDYDNFSKLDEQRLFDVCVDSQALADVTLAGQIVDEARQNLTVDDFIRLECLGWWQDGECWLVPPLDLGTKECWGGPLPGCGPCAVGVFIFNTDCGTPGIPGIVGPIPDFNSTAWEFIGKLGVLVSKTAVLLQSVEECGRVLDALGSPPPRPGALEVLDPAHYGDFDINDLPSFVANFPSFVSNLVTALAELPDYIGSLDDYVNELLESIKGFNNRASSVRWYAPVGVDIVLYDRANYQGGRLTLRGAGNVEETSDLHSKFLDIPQFPPWPAGDLMRSMRFDGTFTYPTLVSHAWSIVSPAPAEPLVLHDTTTATPMFDATGADGPMPATVELVVRDSLGQVATGTANV
jgi:hypothetical protein